MSLEGFDAMIQHHADGLVLAVRHAADYQRRISRGEVEPTRAEYGGHAAASAAFDAELARRLADLRLVLASLDIARTGRIPLILAAITEATRQGRRAEWRELVLAELEALGK